MIVTILVALVVVGCTGAAVTAKSNATASSPQPLEAPTTRPTAAPTGPGLIHEHVSSSDVGGGTGIAFDYPAVWHSVPFVFFLRNFTNGEAGALYPTCCHLQPNTFAASITTSSAVPIDMAQLQSPGLDTTGAGGWQVMTVGDWLVARQTIPTQPTDLIDVHLYWMIGRPGPGKTIYKISAVFRGPDLAPMEAQVEAFIDSMALDPEPTPGPS